MAQIVHFMREVFRVPFVGWCISCTMFSLSQLYTKNDKTSTILIHTTRVSICLLRYDLRNAC